MVPYLKRQPARSLTPWRGFDEEISRQELAALQGRIAGVHRARIAWWVLFLLGVAVIVLSFSMFAITNDNPGGSGHSGYFWDYFVLFLGVLCIVAARVLATFAWGPVWRRISLSRLKSTARRWQTEIDQSDVILDPHQDGLPDPDEGRLMGTVYRVSMGIALMAVVCSVIGFLFV